MVLPDWPLVLRGVNLLTFPTRRGIGDAEIHTYISSRSNTYHDHRGYLLNDYITKDVNGLLMGYLAGFAFYTKSSANGLTGEMFD